MLGIAKLLIRRVRLAIGMKLAVKYGAIIAAGVAIWVLADHFLLHVSRPGAKAAFLTPLFFNLLQLAVLFLGIRAWRQQNQGGLTLGQGISRGIAISVAYGVFASIFFLVFYLSVGSRILENEPAVAGIDRTDKYVLLQAFGGLFLGALIGGLIYSTVISYGLKATPRLAQQPRPRPQASQSRRRR